MPTTSIGLSLWFLGDALTSLEPSVVAFEVTYIISTVLIGSYHLGHDLNFITTYQHPLFR